MGPTHGQCPWSAGTPRLLAATLPSACQAGWSVPGCCVPLWLMFLGPGAWAQSEARWENPGPVSEPTFQCKAPQRVDEDCMDVSRGVELCELTVSAPCSSPGAGQGPGLPPLCGFGLEWVFGKEPRLEFHHSRPSWHLPVFRARSGCEDISSQGHPRRAYLEGRAPVSQARPWSPVGRPRCLCLGPAPCFASGLESPSYTLCVQFFSTVAVASKP